MYLRFCQCIFTMPSMQPVKCLCGKPPRIVHTGCQRQPWRAKCPDHHRSSGKAIRGCRLTPVVYSVSRKGAVGRWNTIMEELAPAPMCERCGLRGEHVCILPIENYVRSGRPSSGILERSVRHVAHHDD